MAEYIDREKIFPNGVFYVSAENPESSLNELINRICNLPTADVVPKSELDAEHNRWLRLVGENNMLENKLYFERQEVSTEIFEEIDEIMANIEIYVSDRERTNFEIGAYKCHASISLKIAELKKKYTGD